MGIQSGYKKKLLYYPLIKGGSGGGGGCKNFVSRISGQKMGRLRAHVVALFLMVYAQYGIDIFEKSAKVNNVYLIGI